MPTTENTLDAAGYKCHYANSGDGAFYREYNATYKGNLNWRRVPVRDNKDLYVDDARKTYFIIDSSG